MAPASGSRHSRRARSRKRRPCWCTLTIRLASTAGTHAPNSVLLQPPTLRLITAGRTTGRIHKAAVRDGMVPFRRSALLKAAYGETALEEISRVVPAEYLVED